MSSPPTPKRLKTSSIPANAQNHLLAQQQQQQQQQQLHPFQPVPPFEGMHMPPPQVPPPNPRKRRSSHQPVTAPTMAAPVSSASTGEIAQDQSAGKSEPPRKKGRTNTPWTAEEEQRLKTMRDAGRSWSEIAKTFPARTEGSVKKHWYKDMHYAEFAEDESQALREAIKEYEANKWKVIGQKVGKPAKACEQYAKEHFKDL